jgi:hypothetical protein
LQTKHAKQCPEKRSSALHAAYKRVLKEDGKPLPRAFDLLHAPQLRTHPTTRVTPAMAAGVPEKLWDMADFVRMIEAYERGES